MAVLFRDDSYDRWKALDIVWDLVTFLPHPEKYNLIFIIAIRSGVSLLGIPAWSSLTVGSPMALSLYLER